MERDKSGDIHYNLDIFSLKKYILIYETAYCFLMINGKTISI